MASMDENPYQPPHAEPRPAKAERPSRLKKIGTWMATGGVVVALASEYVLPDRWKGVAWGITAVTTILFGLILVGIAGSLDKR
jgi:hypothetical protein